MGFLERRILVLDDDTEVAAIVSEVSKQLGFKARTIHHSREFVLNYKEFQPTVISLDIVMPEYDGIEIIRWLIDQDNRAPVILLTGHSLSFAKAAMTMVEHTGNFEIITLTKPFHIDELENMLGRVGKVAAET